MADNFVIPAVDDIAASRDVGGVKYARNLLSVDVDGEGTMVDVDADNPLPVATPQGTPTHEKVTLTAATAATVLAAGSDLMGCRILNFTASPVYITQGTAGTPPSGAEADYIPAAVAGIPGQWEAPYRPVSGLRGISASAGDLTVVHW